MTLCKNKKRFHNNQNGEEMTNKIQMFIWQMSNFQNI